jgi:glucan phosphoethanolaminetransferase (alkaline phosphatase superfamily)
MFILFFEFIFNIISTYIFTVLPILIIASVACMLFGMCIKAGSKAGIGVLLILLTGIIFIFVVYGKDSIKIFKNVQTKLYDIFFGRLPFKNNKQQESSDNNNNNNNEL